MPLYELTYPFESSGGNIAYQTSQQVQQDAQANDLTITLVTTGSSIDGETLTGTAIVDVSDDIAPTDTFASATDGRQVVPANTTQTSDTGRTANEPAADPEPAEDIPRFSDQDDMADLLARVSESPGQGFLLYSNLTRCRPSERDLWLVTLRSETIDVSSGLTTADVVAFYRDNLAVLDETPALKIGGFHNPAESTIRLCLIASLTDSQEARALAGRTDSQGAMNCYRFELSKASLVVGDSTHGTGHVDAVFRNTAGDEVCSRDLAYQVGLRAVM